MANVTITIEGDANEVVALVRQLGGAVNLTENPIQHMLPQSESAEDAVSNFPVKVSDTMETEEMPEDIEDTVEEPSEWDAASATMFWNLLADNARQIMTRISRSPRRSQKRAQIMHTMQRNGQAFAGTLSSVGHNVKKVETKMKLHNLPRPLILDKDNDSYVVEENFAKLMEEIGVN